MWTCSSSPASNFLRAALASANSSDWKRYSLSMSLSRWRASMIRRISAPSMCGPPVRRCLVALQRPPAGRSQGPVQNAAGSAPLACASWTETKRSGRGPLLHAVPGKSAGMVTPPPGQGQPSGCGSEAPSRVRKQGWVTRWCLSAALGAGGGGALARPPQVAARPVAATTPTALELGRRWVVATAPDAPEIERQLAAMPLDDATALALARQLPWFAPEERSALPLDPAGLGRDPLHDLLLL